MLITQSEAFITIASAAEGLAGGLGRMQRAQRGWMTGEGEGSREVFALAVVDRSVSR